MLNITPVLKLQLNILVQRCLLPLTKHSIVTNVLLTIAYLFTQEVMNLSTSGMAGSEKMIKYKDLSVTQESDYKEFKQQDMLFTENKPNV